MIPLGPVVARSKVGVARSDVWTFLADRGRRAEWWPELRLDGTVGGTVAERWSEGEGESAVSRDASGVIDVWVDGHAIGFTWREAGDDRDTAVLLTLRTQGPETGITVTETGFDALPGAADRAAASQEGWAVLLRDLTAAITAADEAGAFTADGIAAYVAHRDAVAAGGDSEDSAGESAPDLGVSEAGGDVESAGEGSGAEAGVEADAEADVDAEAGAEVDAESVVEPGAEAVVDTEADSEAESDADEEVESDNEADAEAGADNADEPDVESEVASSNEEKTASGTNDETDSGDEAEAADEADVASGGAPEERPETGPEADALEADETSIAAEAAAPAEDADPAEAGDPDFESLIRGAYVDEAGPAKKKRKKRR